MGADNQLTITFDTSPHCRWWSHLFWVLFLVSSIGIGQWLVTLFVAGFAAASIAWFVTFRERLTINEGVLQIERGNRFAHWDEAVATVDIAAVWAEEEQPVDAFRWLGYSPIRYWFGAGRYWLRLDTAGGTVRFGPKIWMMSLRPARPPSSHASRPAQPEADAGPESDSLVEKAAEKLLRM